MNFFHLIYLLLIYLYFLQKSPDFFKWIYPKKKHPDFFGVDKSAQPCFIGDVLFFYRCRNSVEFSLQLAWLLQAFCSENTPSRKKSQGAKLRKLILSEELR